MKNLIKELIMLNGFTIDFTKDCIEKEEIEKLQLIFFGNVNEEDNNISLSFNIGDKYFGILSDGKIFRNVDKYDYNRREYSTTLQMYEIELLEESNFCNTILIEEKDDELHVVSFPVKFTFNGTQLTFKTYDYYISKFIIVEQDIKMERLYIFDRNKDEAIDKLDFETVDLYEQIDDFYQDAMMNNYYYVSEKIAQQNNNVKIFFRNCYDEYDFIVHCLIYKDFSEIIQQGLSEITYIRSKFNEVFNSSSYRLTENLSKLLTDESINNFKKLVDNNVLEFLKLDSKEIKNVDNINSFMNKIEEYDLKEYISYYLNVKDIKITENYISLIEESFEKLQDVDFVDFIKFIFRYLNESVNSNLSDMLYPLRRMIDSDFKNELDFKKSFSHEYIRRFKFYETFGNQKEYQSIINTLGNIKVLSDL